MRQYDPWVVYCRHFLSDLLSPALPSGWMIVLASTMSGCTSLKRDAPLSEPRLSKATRADLGRMMAARGLSCSCLTVEQMKDALRRADQSLAYCRRGPQMQSAIFQAHQEVAQGPCRQKRSIVQATRAVLFKFRVHLASQVGV